MRKVSNKGIDFIKKHEGLRLKAYRCPAGVWTVGYGHTRTTTEGLQVTEKQAEDLLLSDLEIINKALATISKNLTQNQYDAVTSLVFNIGIEAFRTSTMRKLIIEQAPKNRIADEFDRWVYIKGQKNNGLILRRKEEKALFLSE